MAENSPKKNKSILEGVGTMETDPNGLYKFFFSLGNSIKLKIRFVCS